MPDRRIAEGNNAVPDMQYAVTTKNILPFIREHCAVSSGMRVLEIGTQHGGVLRAFLDNGCRGTGVEIEDITPAKKYMDAYIRSGKATLIQADILDEKLRGMFRESFDIVVMKDVIEHIPDKHTLFSRIREFLKEDGHAFFGFPPWLMPFGGHQQVCEGWLLRHTPFFHLLPRTWYRALLHAGGTRRQTADHLMELQRAGITMEQFERLAKAHGFSLVAKQLFLFNPVYQFRYGLPCRKLPHWLGTIPLLRNVYTTCVYYLIEKTGGGRQDSL